MVNMNMGEEAIKDYFKIDGLIRAEELNCMVPHKEIDDNVGGGRGGLISNPTAAIGEKLATSKKLINLRETERVVGAEYSKLTSLNKEVIDLFFNTGTSTKKTDKQVKEITQIPVNYLRDIRVNFTIAVCEKMGY